VKLAGAAVRSPFAATAARVSCSRAAGVPRERTPTIDTREILMTKRFVSLAALAGAVLLAGPAAAQIPHITPFSFEGRAGVALPQGDLNDVAKPGWTLSGSVTYHALPLVGIYGGYSYAQFGSDPSGGTYKDHGFDVGARLGIPTPLIPIDPYVKAGVAIHKLELSSGGSSLGSTKFEGGYEVGAGVGFAFGPASLTPGISYLHHKDVSYVRADVGLRIRI
jgi:opacity protein-like surface antigen